ncbi:MAG: glycine--tRNA ligase [Phycisphaeraceae bacterium]
MSQATPSIAPDQKSMEDIVALCKRRGFVYPASEIYGGINGFWDYGPLGTALKNNIRDWWWRQTVECPPIGPDGEPLTIVGLDSAIIQNPRTWEASGHVGGFNDPMVDDTETKQRVRADHLWILWSYQVPEEEVKYIEDAGRASEVIRSLDVFQLIEGKPVASSIGNTPSEALSEFLKAENKVFGKSKAVGQSGGYADGSHWVSFQYREHADGSIWRWIYTSLNMSELAKRHAGIPSPFTQKIGTLTEPRQFNLMFETFVGAIRNEDNKAYLRPETAQGIFLNYKNVLDTMRVKVPFGIAQIGKSFRNEVTPRNFIFRSREFEQMEMEWFCAPDDAPKWYDFWKHERMRWWESLGIEKSNLRFRDHDDDELAHYSKMCVDVEYMYPFTSPGFGELEGVAHRGSFDLTQHQTHSGAKMEYFDQERQLAAKAEGKPKEEIDKLSKYIPNVIEPASGLTRAVLVLLCEAYTPDESRASKLVMKFKPRFAPIKAAVFPLVNKDGMPEVAHNLYKTLRNQHTVQMDAKQSIGKRYARMDEAGTPYCFTIDGDSLTDQTVTVRHRDTQAQERINLDKVPAFLDEHIKN